ncbi:hypothetical protein, partial [Paraburkholderia sp. EG304]|uniref:hypothetical protein n=1 Tax=Paraburkholderia sp. EG304 TaxID=3237015 RepID=UPI00397CEA8D
VIRSITAIEAPRAGQPAAGQLTRRKSGHLNLARSGHYNLAATSSFISNPDYVNSAGTQRTSAHIKITSNA